MKTYLVTGATSGIGKALVCSFKNDDIQVIAIGRDKDKLELLKDSFAPQKITPLVIDLRDISSISSQMHNIFPVQIDGFIHCAGYSVESSLRKLKIEKFQEMMTVNFFSFVEILRVLIANKSREKRLRVIAMSSQASLSASGGVFMYSATKGALDSFVRSSSDELSKYCVEINTIQPVYVDTPMLESVKSFYGEKFVDFIHAHQPLGLIPVEDVVEQIRFLLEKKSKCVTGTSILMNAGKI